MRNKIFGGLGILWGGGMFFRWLLAGSDPTRPIAYQNGQTGAAVFGGLMLLAGLYYFFKKPA